MRILLPAFRGYSPGGTRTVGPYDYVGIIGYGQSLSIGERAYPAVDTTPSDICLMLVDDGYDGADPPTTTTQGTLSLEPLVSPVRGGPLNAGTNEYPRNVSGQTPEVSLALQLRRSLGWTCVTSCCGASNEGIAYLKKGGTGNGYAAIIHEVTEITALAADAGKSYGVAVVLLTHGESDALLADYTAQIAQLIADLRADIPAITGQTGAIRFVISQQTAAPLTTGRGVSALTPGELADTLAHVLPTTKHQYPYYPGEAHMLAPAYRRIGEDAARAFMRYRGGETAALRCTSATREGTTITALFSVPVAPLQWSDTVPDCHPDTEEWAAGRGFEVETSGGDKVTISSVSIVGETVVIECETEPGEDCRLSYAMYQDDTGYNGGLAAGRHGQLCDSDPFVSYSARSISCDVENGSDLVTCNATGDFDDRGTREIVTGSGLSGVVHVVDVDSGSDLVQLSQAWGGATGTATLTFRNDHRHYALAFSMVLA